MVLVFGPYALVFSWSLELSLWWGRLSLPPATDFCWSECASNHCHALSLYFVLYNFVHMHRGAGAERLSEPPYIATLKPI
jgi:hypothetical protein